MSSTLFNATQLVLGKWKFQPISNLLLFLLPSPGGFLDLSFCGKQKEARWTGLQWGVILILEPCVLIN